MAGGTGKIEATISCGAANAPVNAGGEATEGAGKKERGKRPLVLWDGIEVGVGGGGAEGGSGLDQLH